MKNNFEVEKSEFIKYYHDEEDRLKSIASTTKNLIRSLIHEKEFPAVVVSSRVKTLQSCLEKVELKYISRVEAGAKIRDLITDLVGIRVVCLYSDEVAQIVKAITAEMSLVEDTNKIANLDEEEDVFGYRAHHVRVSIGDKRKELPEYNLASNFPIEIQVRTIVQDAWSSVDHRIRYKKAIPIYLKRRVARLAALFELADEEFLSIKNVSSNLENDVAANKDHVSYSENKIATVFDLISILNSTNCDLKIPGYQLDELLGSIRQNSGNIVISDLIEMSKNLNAAVKFFDETKASNENSHDLRIVIRLAFWISSRQRFKSILNPSVRNEFDKWHNNANST